MILSCDACGRLEGPDVGIRQGERCRQLECTGEMWFGTGPKTIPKEQVERALKDAIDYEFPPYFPGPDGEQWRQDVRRRAWRAAAAVICKMHPHIRATPTEGE